MAATRRMISAQISSSQDPQAASSRTMSSGAWTTLAWRWNAVPFRTNDLQ